MEKYKNHVSIESIKTNIGVVPSWNLTYTDVSTVTKLLQNLNTKKSSGWDDLPPRHLKLAAEEISAPLTTIINRGIQLSTFPAILKCANVTLVYKKDRMSIRNCQPVLPSLFKIFENVVAYQLSRYFEYHFSSYLLGL